MKKQESPWQNLLAIVAGLLALHFLFGSRWLLQAALIMAFAGLLFPSLAALISKGWMTLAHLLGRVSNTVLLSLIYFLILTPIAFFRRLGKKRNTGHSNSFYKDRSHTYTAADLENTW